MSLTATEARLRRTARSVGIVIMKSRRRNPNAYDYGGYMLVCGHRNTVLAGGHPQAFSLDLDEVAQELTPAPDGGIMGRARDGSWAF
jgi:hypothetical protein